MIKIYLGNIGSGKTLMAVREMHINLLKIKTYSNIVTSFPSQIDLNKSMIVEDYLKEVKTLKKGKKEIWDKKVNVEFWQRIPKPLNVVLDEAHTILNSRRAMSKTNVITTEWLSLLRRVLGSGESGVTGDLTLISQLSYRLDPICRDMARKIVYHRCFWIKQCLRCGFAWRENSDMPEEKLQCKKCRGVQLQKRDHYIHVYSFSSMKAFSYWEEYPQMRTYYSLKVVRNINKYFPMYNTLQWENLFSD